MQGKVIHSALVKMIEGDKKAFDTIFMEYHRKIFFFCMKYFYSREESEGIVQEVFIKVWLNRKNIDPNKNFELYLFKITKHHVLNDLRKKLNARTGHEDYHRHLQDSDNMVENEVMYRELESLFYDSIKNLPPKRKEIFVLSKIEGLSYREIAEKLNISVKTVETHMQLALDYLRKVFAARNLNVFAFLLVWSFCL